MKQGTSFPALVCLSLSLGAPSLFPAAAALAPSVPHYYGQLLPRQINTTTGVADGGSCISSFDCLTSFCRAATCVNPATVVGQVADGGQCFDNASCETAGSVCDGTCVPTSTPTLTPNGGACSAAAQCSSGFCTRSGGQCADPSTIINQGLNDPCRTDSNCASTFCQNGSCATRPPSTNTTTGIPTNSGGCGSASIAGDALCQSGYCFEARDDPFCADPREISNLPVGQHCYLGSALGGGNNCLSPLTCDATRFCVNTTTTTMPNPNATVVATGGACTPPRAASFASARRTTCWATTIDQVAACSDSSVCSPPQVLRPLGASCSATADCVTGRAVVCQNISAERVGSGTCTETKEIKTFLVPTNQNCALEGAKCWSGDDKCPIPAANFTSSRVIGNSTCLSLNPLATETQACSAQADCGRAFNRAMACVGLVADKVGAGKCERIKPYELEGTCAESKECRSLNCLNKVCKPPVPGPDPVSTPCNVSTSCNTTFCALPGRASTVQLCLPPFTAPVNSECTVDEICVSARCINDRCTDPTVSDVTVDPQNAVTDPDGKSGISTPVLVGCIVGGVVGLVLLATCLFFVVKALKGGTAATTALHSVHGAQQAQNAHQQQQQDHHDDHKFEPKIQDFSILMLGLDRAGKSMFIGKAQSILNFVKFKPGNIRPNPVKKGVIESKIAYLNAIFTFQDQSGAVARRSKWIDNLDDHHAVCFIVDSTDRQRINEAYAALQTVLASPWMTGIPLIVLVNKLDSPRAEPFAQVQAHFNTLLCPRPAGSAWAVMGISAIRGDGLQDAVQWLYTWCQSSRKTIQQAATASVFSHGLTYV